MYKCFKCRLTIKDEFLDNGLCPECNGQVVEMCPNDVGSCNHGVVDGSAICEECGADCCPICGAHDVEVLSRTTGYYGPKSSFGAGKQAEFKDRKRYNL